MENGRRPVAAARIVGGENRVRLIMLLLTAKQVPDSVFDTGKGPVSVFFHLAIIQNWVLTILFFVKVVSIRDLLFKFRGEYRCEFRDIRIAVTP